jgi:hypothetical protein
MSEKLILEFFHRGLPDPFAGQSGATGMRIGLSMLNSIVVRRQSIADLQLKI